MAVDLEKSLNTGRAGHDDSTVVKSATATLKPYEQVVAVVATGAATITLPPVSECTGLIFDITAVNGSTYTVTVADNNGDAALSDITLNADGESTTLYCTGRNWREIKANYS